MVSDTPRVTRVEEATIVEEIRRKVADSVVSWRELVELCNRLGVSVNRLRKILLALTGSGEVIELKCRLFTSRRFLEVADRAELEEKIKETVARSGLRKCGKPLSIPLRNVLVVISKSGDVYVVYSK